MAKHIAIFGSPGSGKSVFCAALARATGKRKKRVLLISGDSTVPMLPFFCGDSDTVGLGQLCSGAITPQRTAEAVKVLRDDPDIGVMGLQFDDEPIEGKGEQIKALYEIVDSMVDVVIWDGTAAWNSEFYTAVLPKADGKVCILTADVKGLLYFQRYCCAIQRLKDCLLLEGLGKPYSLREEISLRIGGFHGLLPFGREIERYVMEGRIFSVDRCCHEQYQKAVEYTLDWLLKRSEGRG